QVGVEVSTRTIQIKRLKLLGFTEHRRERWRLVISGHESDLDQDAEPALFFCLLQNRISVLNDITLGSLGRRSGDFSAGLHDVYDVVQANKCGFHEMGFLLESEPVRLCTTTVA